MRVAGKSIISKPGSLNKRRKWSLLRVQLISTKNTDVEVFDQRHKFVRTAFSCNASSPCRNQVSNEANIIWIINSNFLLVRQTRRKNCAKEKSIASRKTGKEVQVTSLNKM